MKFRYAGKCRLCGQVYQGEGNFKNYDTFRKAMEKRCPAFLAECGGCKRMAVIDLGGIEARPKGDDGKAVANGETAAAWEAYSIAYEHRYGIAPIRNAAVNSQMKAFVQRVPAEEAPLIAAYYVTSNDRFFVAKGHPVNLLPQNAERLRTEAMTGNRITQAQAIAEDKTDGRKQMWLKLIEEMEES